MSGPFLPIEGGNENDYDYCTGDAINCVDLDGQWGISLKKLGNLGKLGGRLVSAYDKAMAVRDLARGRWRQALVGFAAGAAVGGLCGAVVFAATAGAGAVLGAAVCTAFGAAAGQWASSRVKNYKIRPAAKRGQSVRR